MFRTRDFVLIFTVIVFLIMAISGTIFSQSQSSTATGPNLTFVEVSDTEYQAEISSPETLAREERLADMRRKVAESGELMIRAPEETVDENATEEEVTETEEVADTPLMVQQCAGYRTYAGAWPLGVNIEVVEGSRLVYQEIVSEYELDPATATSGTVLPPDTRRDPLLQLPIRSFSNDQQNCLPSDVVGIAQDGSLIRNDELNLYSVFDESTTIGYSLDGFPIHGVTTRPLDACGGAVVNGQYGYYLQAENEFILGCFSATPVSL